MLGDDLLDLLGARIPADRSGQTLADHELPHWLALAGSAAPAPLRVLDLGCGAGDSVDAFRRIDPDLRWTGVDIADSPEVAARTREDAEFATFDGQTLPFEDGAFAMVWCKQVLEHAAAPARLVAEAARVLAPGGVLCGSTSQLEPFHSRSTQNPTPYGLALEIERAGLEVRELRPGIDSATLLARRLVGRRGAIFGRWWDREAPLNRLLSAYGAVRRIDPQRINAAKLVVCGQFTFMAVRPTGG